MQALLDCCCGADVHRDKIEACILKGRKKKPEVIRAQFKTTRNDLKAFVSWLYENGCFHIAMESTGVYWRPVYEAIEDYAKSYEQLVVVNAQHMHNIPGRKSDIKDAEWIATLFRHGLLEASYIPDRDIRTLREYSRMYKSSIQEKSRNLNRLEKFLQIHGFKISSVLSNIVGVSGRNLLNTLVEKGEITSDDVINAVGKRIRRPLAEIEAAVCGSLNQDECQILALYLKKLDDSEQDILTIVSAMVLKAKPYEKAVKQLDSIPGIDIIAALAILAEIGITPQDKFKTSCHLNSWAGLSPRNDESAGKIKSRKVMHGNPYIKSILCQCAWSAVRSRNSMFASWFWSHQAKLGRKKAITAVARKILTLIYSLLKTGEFYDSKKALVA